MEDHYIWQGRQQHGWFGTGTKPADAGSVLPAGDYHAPLVPLINAILAARPGDDISGLRHDIVAEFHAKGDIAGGNQVLGALHILTSGHATAADRANILDVLTHYARRDPAVIGAIHDAVLASGAGRVLAGLRDAARQLRSLLAPRPAAREPSAAPKPPAPTPRGVFDPSTGEASLPASPDELLAEGWIETSHPKAIGAGHRIFRNPATGDVVRFDKAKPGDHGFTGKDHYHVLNSDWASKLERYLSKSGAPVADGSDASHIIPNR